MDNLQRDTRTNRELERNKFDLEFRVATLGRELEDCILQLKGINTELARREMEAFWQQNAGLRLAVGDKITITIEYVQWYERKTQQHSRVRAGEVYIIGDIYISDGDLVINTTRLSLAVVDLAIARRMRESWLQAHGETAGE
mgnify:CR=1 FL=1